MEIRIVREPISLSEIEGLAGAWHRTLVKGVADVEREIIALGGEWHMDANTVLIADGSQQRNVWGFNLYQNERGEQAIAFISLINIRPAQGSTEMELKDEKLRENIRDIVRTLVPDLQL